MCPSMTCRKNYWGTCFQQLTTYMCKTRRKKYLRSSHVDGKREIGCFHVENKRQPANAKNGGKIVVIFAVRVSRMRDVKSLYYNRRAREGYLDAESKHLHWTKVGSTVYRRNRRHIQKTNKCLLTGPQIIAEAFGRPAVYSDGLEE